MSERFFSSRPIASERVTLDGPEAHHLLHVMRAAAGDGVTLFDDSGAEFRAIVDERRRSEVVLRIIERQEIDRELPFPLSVGVALPKGDRQKWLIEKLTELGVTTLVPLKTERSVAEPVANSLDRLRRSAIEAAKQCGRNRLMRIAEPRQWHDWIAGDCGLRHPKGTRDCGLRADSETPDALSLSNAAIQIRRLVAHPDGNSLGAIDMRQQIPTLLAIGPEGGLAAAEIRAADAAAWQRVSLGRRILRTDTAAVALAAAFSLQTP